MIPEALFTFITNGLNIYFKDRSTNSPTSWLWDFGDTNTSTDQDPTHIYATSGNYTVTLIATNATGPSVAYVFEIMVDEQNDILIDDIIAFELPPSILVDENNKNYLLKKWRLYLQDAFQIDDLYLNDEAQYSQLQNILLAKLVVYDLMILEAKKYMSSVIGSTANSASGATGGNIKKIETGPTNAEWYDGSDTLKSLFSPNADGISTWDELFYSICALAQKLRVKLPMCQLHTNPIVPIKALGATYLSTHDYLTKYYGAN